MARSILLSKYGPTDFPLSHAFADFDNFSSGFMSRAALLNDLSFLERLSAYRSGIIPRRTRP